MSLENEENTGLTFDKKAQSVLSAITEKNDHIIVLGSAGTGKSFLLNHIRGIYSEPFAVLAPTGISAINIGGQTIHSFFRFGPGITVEKAYETGGKRSYDKVIRNIHTIFLDEISMVRADILDCIDVFLQSARGNPSPFGGVRIIMFGDLYQLPPVLTRYEQEAYYQKYPSPFFFSSHAMSYYFQRESGLQCFELDHIYRQKDRHFIDLLSNIRLGRDIPQTLETLNAHVGQQTQEGGIKLTTINKKADQINYQHLDQIGTPTVAFEGVVAGNFDTKNVPSPEKLFLKIGAQVMFTKNDKDGRWVNGTLGVVTGFQKKAVAVELETSEIVMVEPVVWETHRTVFDQETQTLESELVGSYTQIPLKLAWAITIHKSQGLTFDELTLDLDRGAFVEGQTYVALSRCRSLEGLSLARPVRANDIKVHPTIQKFYEFLSER